ncbi:MAG: hypothetical protein LBJ00_14530 [Planctomycetaceae bacterium]|nr:hypothetical protein [Planctomycetaceae bacterium]
MVRFGGMSTTVRFIRQPCVVVVHSSDFEIPEAEHASVASRSDCSRAKPTAQTSSGITSAL